MGVSIGGREQRSAGPSGVLKRDRLEQWCEDATTDGDGVTYRPMYIQEEDWDTYRVDTFDDLTRLFGDDVERSS